MSHNGSLSGGANHSGSVTLNSTFAYTFLVDQTLEYSLTGMFGSDCPFNCTLDLTGPGGSMEALDSACGTISFDETGTLEPGEYTLAFEAGGTVAFVGPGGNDAGGGGTFGTPVLRFQVAVPSSCDADMDGNNMVDVFDLLAYLDLWFVADAAADIDGAPGVDVFDLLSYLDGWFAGC